MRPEKRSAAFLLVAMAVLGLIVGIGGTLVAAHEGVGRLHYHADRPQRGPNEYMDKLTRDLELTAEQRDHLKTVKASADSLLTIVNGILDLSKVEAGKAELDTVEFDLRDNLEETIRSLAWRADDREVELTCELAADVPIRVPWPIASVWRCPL